MQRKQSVIPVYCDVKLYVWGLDLIKMNVYRNGSKERENGMRAVEWNGRGIIDEESELAWHSERITTW